MLDLKPNFDKYHIRVYESEKSGKPCVQIFNTNCRAYNASIAHYVFRTAEERDKYVENFKANVNRRNEEKAQRKAERKAFKNPAKVGDLLRASWGYDQTNVDYFQVTKVLRKMVEVREIGQKTVEGSTYPHGMADTVGPVKNNFLTRGTWCKEGNKPMRKVVKPSGYKDYAISLESFANAYKVDENDKTYRSWYA